MNGRRALLGLAAGGTLALAGRGGKPAAVAAEGRLRPLGVALKLRHPPAAPGAAVLVDAAGGVHGLGEFAGRGLVVNLWASWCAPCVVELPALAVLAGRVEGDGVAVLAASSDRGGAAAVAAFYRAHGITALGVWLDPQGAAQRAWGVDGIPTTLVIDRAGRERGRAEGAVDWAEEAAAAEIRRLVQL